MANFKYKATDENGNVKEGIIDAVSLDVAISALQRRGLTVLDIQDADKKSLLEIDLSIFSRVKNKDIVILSRQIATLFEAQISAMRAFRLLAAEAENPELAKILTQIADDIQGGATIADALSKHPDIFNSFYVAMVRSGEESGNLVEIFEYLADYLDKTYAVTSKAKKALVYPAFIVVTFISVMVLMMVTVIPKLASVLVESGQDIPLFTKIIINLSLFMKNYFWLFLIIIVAASAALFRYFQTEQGKEKWSELKLSIPYLGKLYKFLYLSRMADSLSTGLKSGIRLVRSVDTSANVVDDPSYHKILKEVTAKVQTGVPLSDALKDYPEFFPGIMIAMIKIGEESGEMGPILDVMAKFYRREVEGAVDMLVSMIEPLMIVMLAVGVGFLLAAVLIPIYNISAGV